ncbi:MAG: carbohydrate ABC transporter permease [Firmicutes bacterium]|nr:carbohydrate ABC transporter permease [Bacillota bacterium]
MDGKQRKTDAGDVGIIIFMLFLIALCILPVMNVVATAFSSPGAVMRQAVTFLPVEFQTGSFMDVLSDSRFMRSMAWTGILTAIVVVINLFMTILCAYPLTYDSLKGRKIISLFIIFTMLFSAGLIPAFILFRDLGLINNPLVLILPGMISVFNMIIMRNFFMGIPESLKESAEMDGGGPMTVLIKIYLPLSTPVMATIGLFYAVGRWNGFQDALFFLPSAPDWHPIQLLLYNILQNLTAVDAMDPGASAAPGWGQTVQSAAIVIAMIPILCVYPFVQKYFVQGATLGAVKG